MHRAVLLLVLVVAAAMAPPAQPGRLSAVNPWLSACDLSDTDEPYGQSERVCDDMPARERARLLSTTYLRHCRERSLMSALSEEERNAAIGGGAACHKVLANLRIVDDIAARTSMDLGSILARYDCGQTFSVIHACSDCQESYRRWVCSALLPMFVSGSALGQGAHQGGAGAGRGTRSASQPPRQQPPPPSPPRKRSTSRDNYKLYASNNKNTKLKTNEYPDINKNNNNNNEKIINKNNNIDNYDNVMVTNDNLFRNSDYESVYSSIILDSDLEEDLMLVDEETMLYYASHGAFEEAPPVYGNTTRSGSVHSRSSPSSSAGNVSVLARVTEPPWNERAHTRSEQRAADARKDLDNRLGSSAASGNTKTSDSESRKRRRRNTTSAETGRYRLRPCLAVCQDVERTCPYFLPGDRAPSYPTQYAGEPTFLCLDPNIEETGEQLRKSNYGDVDCCYVYCGPAGDLVCPRCKPSVSLPSQDQPYAPQCSASPNPVTTNPNMSSQQTRTTAPNLVIVFLGLSISCAHFLSTLINNLIVINKQCDTRNYKILNISHNKNKNINILNNKNIIINNNKAKDKIILSHSNSDYYITINYKNNKILLYNRDFINNIIDFLTRIIQKWFHYFVMRILECVRL